MPSYRPASYAAAACAVIAALAGCEAPAPTVPSISGLPAIALTARPDRGPSWMSPDAKGNDLLYVSDLATDDVDVYAYRTGALKGRLKGFKRPWGLCADTSGHVFITDELGFRIREYAHGGTKPIVTLKDPGEEPGGCSVDPSTGNLAVANISTPASNPGDIAIYRAARGGRKTFKDSSISYYEYCGYDDAGDLFLDGSQSGDFRFAELPNGSGSFQNITLDEDIQYGGSVQWDGQYVTVRDYEANEDYRFKIAAGVATEVGAFSLQNSAFTVQVWVEGDTIAGANADGGNAAVWDYPEGGPPVETISGPTTPWGVTVSPAKAAPSGAPSGNLGPPAGFDRGMQTIYETRER